MNLQKLASVFDYHERQLESCRKANGTQLGKVTIRYGGGEEDYLHLEDMSKYDLGLLRQLFSSREQHHLSGLLEAKQEIEQEMAASVCLNQNAQSAGVTGLTIS